MTDDRTDAVNYDVAISFLTTDEPLALELADNLTGLEVFVYSKEQEAIGGTDGLETFGHVFRDDSRIQAVLYRDGWGATPWTRVEAMAIRDKCLSDGFDNLVFVRLDDSELPDWVPKTHLYVDYETYGMDQLLGVLRRKAEERGSVIKLETPSEKARRLASRQAFDTETAALRRHGDGVRGARQLLDVLHQELDSHVHEIVQSMEMQTGRTHRAYGFTTDEVTAILGIEDWPGNMLGDNARLAFTFWRGRQLLPGERAVITGNPKRITNTYYPLHRTPILGYCWMDENGKVRTSEQLASQLMMHFLEESERLRHLDYDPFDRD